MSTLLHRSSRRQFLKTSVVATGGLFAVASSSAAR
jgi:hypothetical protein